MAAMNPNGGPNPSESYCIYNCSHSPSPLTTTFTPPTRCSDYWTPVLTLGVVSPTISFTQNVTRAGCAPSGWASCSHCGMTISPGICPSGWPVASVGIANGVTTSYCCPSGAANYTSDTDTPNSRCSGTFTDSLMKLTYSSTWSGWTYAYSTMLIAGLTTPPLVSSPIGKSVESSETIFVYTGMLAADAIIVNFEDNELSTSVALASPTSANASPLTSSKTSSTGPTSSAAPSPPGEQGNLSSGAKAGIGVAAALGVCAVATFGLLIYRSRKRNMIRGSSAPGWERRELSNEPVEAKELSNDAMTARELPDSSRPELNGHHGVT